jgi:hypothetical protein
MIFAEVYAESNAETVEAMQVSFKAWPLHAQAGPLIKFDAAFPGRAVAFPAAMPDFPSQSRSARSTAALLGSSGGVAASVRCCGGELRLFADAPRGSSDAIRRATPGVAHESEFGTNSGCTVSF